LLTLTNGATIGVRFQARSRRCRVRQSGLGTPGVVEFSLQRKKHLLSAPLVLLSLVFASWVAMFRGQVTLGAGAALMAATPLLLMLHLTQTVEGVLLNKWHTQ
jgi:hypothetical protein